MLRRTFLATGFAALSLPAATRDAGNRLAMAARAQLGVTTGYDPRYIRIPYPMGDVPRSTGVCADVIVRAGRDALGLDLQRLVHEDMTQDFGSYPHTWGLNHADSNIDHRRVLNLEVFWRRAGAQVWFASGKTDGDAFPEPLMAGDILTWMLVGSLPHVGIVVASGATGPRIVQNIGSGVQENALWQMKEQRAHGHFRWPAQ
jgi:uncharacterized protein YijF (DUF1287 family)